MRILCLLFLFCLFFGTILSQILAPPAGQRCAGRNWNGRRCCTPENPCDEGEGDCDGPGDGGKHDGHAGCKGDLVCGSNNCKKFGLYYHENDDCCERPEGHNANPISNPNPNNGFNPVPNYGYNPNPNLNSNPNNGYNPYGGYDQYGRPIIIIGYPGYPGYPGGYNPYGNPGGNYPYNGRPNQKPLWMKEGNYPYGGRPPVNPLTNLLLTGVNVVDTLMHHRPYNPYTRALKPKEDKKSVREVRHLNLSAPINKH